MQGPVYGIETEESTIDVRLRTIFNYDELFGTVINRFITQAIIGHPITVYGKGGQTRGYINIKDTLQCVHVSAQNPAKKGELKIYNQIMETFTVNQLATLVQGVGLGLGYDVKIETVKNPRVEMEDHYYNPVYQGLVELGVSPNYLTEESIKKMFLIISENKENIKINGISMNINW
jgi:UDP-sulfoquinovose synthase